jgi:hypothetical protein
MRMNQLRNHSRFGIEFNSLEQPGHRQRDQGQYDRNDDQRPVTLQAFAGRVFHFERGMFGFGRPQG